MQTEHQVCTSCADRLATRDAVCCARCVEGWHTVACSMRQVTTREALGLPHDPRFSTFAA